MGCAQFAQCQGCDKIGLSGDYTNWNLKTFANAPPCCKQMTKFVNKLKTEGSLAGYGNAFHPKDFGVDGDTLRCAAPPHELYEGLSEPEQARAKAAEEYLLGFAES